MSAGGVDELNPRPSRSAGNSGQQLAPTMVLPTKETGEVDKRAKGSSVHTLPRVNTGASCADVNGNRTSGTSLYLGFSAQPGRWPVGGSRRSS